MSQRATPLSIREVDVKSKFHSVFRYFPVREIYVQTSGFHHHHQPKMENPGTTRVYCSVYIFTVNLQAITSYPPYLTTIFRNDKIIILSLFSGWVVCVIFIFRSFQIDLCLFLKVLDVFPVSNIDSNQR